MGSRSNKLSRHIPATLELAGLLLQPRGSDDSQLRICLRDYALEWTSGQANLAQEFAPFFYCLLNEQGRIGTLAGDLHEQLRDSALTAASTALARRHIISKIADRLTEASVNAILLKGAAMDQWSYPAQGFRLGSDIDLLVRESDYSRIEQLLTPLAQHQEKYPGRDAFNKFVIEKPFLVSHPARVYLDVHRDLTTPHVYLLNPEELFERARPHPAYPNLLIMSPEDNLLHFAVHSFCDMRLFNKQTLDAYQMIAGNTIDWSTLANRASRYGMKQPLTYFLYGLREAFEMRDTGIPEDMGNPDLAKRWLIDKLLTTSPATLAKRDVSYRVRQLALQTFLSGNIWGFARYNLAYTKVRITDLSPSFWPLS